MKTNNMKNFWFYFYSALVSLIGSNLFLFTQGWFLLKETGVANGVGLTWALFFLPALLFLPAIGKVLDTYSLRTVISATEAIKCALFILFSIAIRLSPTPSLVYLLSVFYGLCFSIYFASVYVAVKRLVPQEDQAKYSHISEVSLQVSNVLAAVVSGFIYESIGFENLLLVSAVFTAIGFLGARQINEVARSEFSFSSLFAIVRESYANTGKFLKKQFLPAEKEETRLEKRDYIFGMFHLFPHAIIMVSNIPIIFYASEILKVSAVGFGVLDSLIGVAGIAVGLFWSKNKALSLKSGPVVILAILGALVLALTPSATNIWITAPLALFFMGATLISTKILSRGQIVSKLPVASAGTYTTLFQMMGTAMLLALLGIVSLVRAAFGPSEMFITLAVCSLLYSFFVWKLKGEEKCQPSNSVLKIKNQSA